MKKLTICSMATVLVMLSSCNTVEEMDTGLTEGGRSSGIPVILNVSVYDDDEPTVLDGWDNAKGQTRSETSNGHGTNGNYSLLKKDDEFNVHFISGVTVQQSRYVIDRAVTYEIDATDGRIKKGVAVARTRIHTGTESYEDTTNPQPFFVDGATTAYCRAYYPATNPIVAPLWTVQQDQSTFDGLKRSDLMFAEGTSDPSISGAATANTTINMAPFQHRMARLRVTLTPGTSAEGMMVKQIDIVGGAYRTVNILDSEKLITGHDLTDPCTETAPLKMCPTDRYSADMDFAVLLPAQMLCQQTVVDTKEKLLRIMLTNSSGSNTGTIYVAMAPKKIDAGHTYTINLNVLNIKMKNDTVRIGSWNESHEVTYNYAAGNLLTGSSNGLYQVGNTTFRMLSVKKGSTIGKLSSEPTKGIDMTGRNYDYYMAETETTQAMWKASMGDLSSLTYQPDKIGDDLPIYGYSWDQLKTFFQNLNTNTGGQRPANYYFTLPTLDEWRYAAQGGAYSKGYAYPGGDDKDKVAWTSQNAGGSSHPVAQLRANELGLYDMIGNYWELVADYWFSVNDRTATGGAYINQQCNDMWVQEVHTIPFGPTSNLAWSGKDLDFRIALIHQDDMQECQKFAIPGNTTP